MRNGSRENEKSNHQLQISNRSSTGKAFTESTPINSPFKKMQTFGFPEVNSEISEASFQMRKRTESHFSHLSPLIIRPSKIEVYFK